MSEEELLNYLKEEIRELQKTQIKILVEIAGLKVKASYFGFLSGVLGGAIGIFINLFNKGN